MEKAPTNQETHERLTKMYSDVDAAIVRVDQALVRIDLFVAETDKAFPDGDRRRHHDVHTKMQRRESDRAEFWKKLALGFATTLSIAMAILLATGLVFYLKFGWMTVAP